MDVMLGPDVFVNASVALGSPPDKVVQRVLGGAKRSKSSEWILARVEAMLRAVPSFKADAVGPQIDTIRKLVDVVEVDGDFGADAWVDALVASAKAAGITRVITDHPDLADKDEVDGVEFLSSDAWLVEQTMPPPPPG